MLRIGWIPVISLLFYQHIITHQAICLEKRPKCDVNTSITDKEYLLQVRHGSPTSLNGRNGSVSINASVIGEYRDSDSCEWTFDVDGVILMSICTNISKTYSLPWYFSKPGLKIVTVTARFIFERLYFYTSEHIVQNCTIIDVRDCSRELQLVLSTSKRTFYISKNQSELVLDSPGPVNFTVYIFNTNDPFYICRTLSYNWRFGDGVQSDETRKPHIGHHYNSSGVFNMSLDVFDPAKQLENISLTIFIKEIHHHHVPSNAAAIDVSLVLVICLAAFILVVCSVVILRRRVQRFTEVARFDFRHEEFQSENDKVLSKPRLIVRNFMNTRQQSKVSEHQLLLPSINSSHSSFGTILPTEEL